MFFGLNLIPYWILREKLIWNPNNSKIKKAWGRRFYNFCLPVCFSGHQASSGKWSRYSKRNWLQRYLSLPWQGGRNIFDRFVCLANVSVSLNMYLKTTLKMKTNHLLRPYLQGLKICVPSCFTLVSIINTIKPFLESPKGDIETGILLRFSWKENKYHDLLHQMHNHSQN